MKHTFQHRFKGGVTVTLSYDIDETTPDKLSLAKCQWSKKPSERIIPEYLRWKHSVCERLAEISGSKIIDIVKTKLGVDGWETWVYEPGKPGRKLTS
jgi:hypothetical protein